MMAMRISTDVINLVDSFNLVQQEHGSSSYF